jgi:hypothetical protein
MLSKIENGQISGRHRRCNIFVRAQLAADNAARVLRRYCGCSYVRKGEGVAIRGAARRLDTTTNCQSILGGNVAVEPYITPNKDAEPYSSAMKASN